MDGGGVHDLMGYGVREAKPTDLESVAAFTTDTFDWGDYVADSFTTWLEDSSIRVIVVVDDDDRPVALAKMRLSGPRQLWMSAARVHPDHRGRGLGALMNDDGLRWGREHGSRVARLLIEEWNEAAQRQVTKSAYRKTSTWVYATRSDLQSDPNPLRNGGPRVPGPERLVPAAPSQVDEAYMAWASGDLMRAARGLITRDWVFWTMTPDDLSDARQAGTLWHCPSGWAIGRVDNDGARFAVSWLQASPDDYARVIRACLDHAVDANLTDLALWVPADPTLSSSLDRLGFISRRSSIWELPL